MPGFTLFRRQPSLVANPTTQGASLRGIGATGASRALVLVDGVPMHDAFGGWVAWGRLPLDLVDRVEVVRGGGSSLWGSGALGGVIHIVTRAPEGADASLRVEGGNHRTRRATVIGEKTHGAIAGQFDATYDDFGGYYLVSGGERVAFDTRADSRDAVLGLRSDWQISEKSAATVRLRYFDEKRDNGTALTGNDTDIFFAHAGIEGNLRPGDGYAADVYGQAQDFSSTFSAQDRELEIETPALDQFEVPSGTFGIGARWWRKQAGNVAWLAGADYRYADGFTHERFRYIGGGFTRRRKAGGREQLAGGYVQRTQRFLGRFELTAGARLDYWRSDNGERKEVDVDTGEELVDASIDARDDVFVSPRVGLTADVTQAFRLRTAAYRGFRAPSLNELYRPFRVRNDITEANAGLDLERLSGVDVGFDLGDDASSLAFTAFWNRLDDPIVNVTVADGPGDVPPCGFVPEGGTCRQRKNLGHTRTFGVEIDAQAELAPRLRARGAYLLSVAEIRADGAVQTLQGNDVPQVPEHQLVAFLDWTPWSRVAARLEGRYVGTQYEDDANTRRLADYFTLGAGVSFAVDRHWELFVLAENVIGDRYEVGESADGTVSYGPAALVHGGVRYRAAR